MGRLDCTILISIYRLYCTVLIWISIISRLYCAVLICVHGLHSAVCIMIVSVCVRLGVGVVGYWLNSTMIGRFSILCPVCLVSGCVANIDNIPVIVEFVDGRCWESAAVWCVVHSSSGVRQITDFGKFSLMARTEVKIIRLSYIACMLVSDFG